MQIRSIISGSQGTAETTETWDYGTYRIIYFNIFKEWSISWKLDRVGTIDNRPSTNKLQQFKKKREKKGHVTHDMWHMTADMLLGVNILSKCLLPSS